MPLLQAAIDHTISHSIPCEKGPALRVFERTARYYGFNKFAICSFPRHAKQPVPLALSAHWPDEWCHQYLNEGSYRHDPIMQYDRTYRLEIFHWHDAIDKFANSPRACRVIGQRLENGIGHGCSIPLSLPSNRHISVHMAGDHHVDLRQADQGVVVMAAQMLAGLFTAMPDCAASAPGLSELEREVLTWASMGKSPAEISEEMQLTDQTTISHLESARHLLGAANWTHAVVLALQQKLITI